LGQFFQRLDAFECRLSEFRSGLEQKPKYGKYFADSDLIAGNFLFMRKYMPERMDCKTVVTNTTTEENIELFKARGVKTVITTNATI
jgi:hypothetical protein